MRFFERIKEISEKREPSKGDSSTIIEPKKGLTINQKGMIAISSVLVASVIAFIVIKKLNK